MSALAEKRILLGVTGGISAFKAIAVLRLLTKRGACVDVVMTERATQFVGPATFRGLSARPVVLDLYDLPGGLPTEEGVMPHLALAEEADLALVVPATANTMAKMACGLADNALLTTLLSVTAPVLVAPAMDSDMWRHPATQANVAMLKSRGVRVIGPVEGELARRNVGPGRLADPEVIVAEAERTLSLPAAETLQGPHGPGGPKRVLSGRRVLVTAGGTRESLDPVRYIGNRSSGKMGFALAEQAGRLGAAVVLVTGPTSLAPPPGCQVVRVEAAAEMQREVMARAPESDAVLMAAAVSDYRAETVERNKVKKEKDSWQVTLVRNPDIAALVGAGKSAGQVLVAFAAETDELLEQAAKKLKAKRADMVVANDVGREGSGFDVDTNEVTLLFPDGRREPLPLMTKTEVAEIVMGQVASLLESK